MPPSRRGWYERVLEPFLSHLNRRTSILIFSAFFSLTLFAWYRSVSHAPPHVLHHDYGELARQRGFDGVWDYQRDAENLMLDSRQCDQAFPGLFEEVDRPMRERMHNHITFEEIDTMPRQNGYVRCMIYNQQVRLQVYNTSLTLRSVADFSLGCNSCMSSTKQEVYTHARLRLCTPCTAPFSRPPNLYPTLNSHSIPTTGSPPSLCGGLPAAPKTPTSG